MPGRLTLEQALDRAESIDVSIIDSEGAEISVASEDVVLEALETYEDSISPVTDTGENEVTLFIGGRSTVEVYYNVSSGDRVIVETGNVDGVFRPLDVIDTSESGTDSEDNVQIPWVARPRVKVSVEGDGGTLDIAAGR